MLDSWTMRTKESQKRIRSKPSVNCRSDDTAFGAATFSRQDPVHSWKADPGEVMTVENLNYLWL